MYTTKCIRANPSCNFNVSLLNQVATIHSVQTFLSSKIFNQKAKRDFCLFVIALKSSKRNRTMFITKDTTQPIVFEGPSYALKFIIRKNGTVKPLVFVHKIS